jgi:hypothetical protein
MEALKMERRVDNWNDDRLDELSRRMDEGFKEMREGFAQTVSREEMKELIASINERVDRVERETKEGFKQVDQRFEQVEQRFEQVGQRFDRLYYVMITASLGLVASVILAVTLG